MDPKTNKIDPDFTKSVFLSGDGLAAEEAARRAAEEELWRSKVVVDTNVGCGRCYWCRRNEILKLPEDDPAAMVWQTGDFYSLSGCRDLLYHRREVRYGWPEIGEALRELDLKLVGVETATAALKVFYRERFPDDPAAVNPSNWDVIEREYPDSFLAMYQFWCQA